MSSQILATRGRIYPATNTNVTLAARMDDGSLVRGETSITASPHRILELMLSPADAEPLPGTLDAIANADLITLGPGSLYTSLITNLLVRGIPEAIAASSATRVYVGNLMTQANESLGLTASQHIEKILQHCGHGNSSALPKLFDYALINTAPISPTLLAQYAREGQTPHRARPRPHPRPRRRTHPRQLRPRRQRPPPRPRPRHRSPAQTRPRQIRKLTMTDTRQLRIVTRACIFALSIAPALSLAPAQNAAAPPAGSAATVVPAYDVMTIRPNKTSSGSVDIDTDDDRYSATNVSLKQLLENAYDIKQDLISGIPGPLDSVRFDIEAKISEPDHDALKKLTPEQERQQILPLLTERFQLKVHTETKTLPVYELVLITGGPKFKPSADQTKTGGGGMSVHGGRTLTRPHRPRHPHDFPSRKRSPARSTAPSSTRPDSKATSISPPVVERRNPDSGAEQAPSIFTAIQEQLGLKLQPAKGPVDTLVVDHAEMPPKTPRPG